MAEVVEAIVAMAEGLFPRSVATGPNTRAWVEEEVDAWIQARIDARDMGTDADLRALNPNIGKGRPRRDQATPAALARAEQHANAGI